MCRHRVLPPSKTQYTPIYESAQAACAPHAACSTLVGSLRSHLLCLQPPSPVAHSSPSFACFARFAWGVLAYFIAVILWGTLVRATGSGDGCGDHWPLCNGTVMQHSPTLRHDDRVHASHHQRHLVLLRCRRCWCGPSPRPCAAIWRAAAGVHRVAFTVIEAMLGALLVKLGLTAQSQSPLRAPYLALHLTNTLLLLAALTLTAHLLSRRAGYLREQHSLASRRSGPSLGWSSC